MYREYGYGCEGHFHHHGHGEPYYGGHHHHHGCCCGVRHFPTREEMIEELEEYLEQLKAEVQGVEERLAELKK